jgi:hypothetical protein
MSTTITTSWQLIKEVYVGNSGYHDVYWRMYARISAQNSTNTTIQVEGRLYLTGSGYFYAGAVTTVGGTVGNYSAWGVDASGTYYGGNEYALWGGSDTVATSTGSAYAGVRFYSSPWGWTGDNLYISDTLVFAAAPAVPTVSAALNADHSAVTVTWGTTSFGTPNSGNVYLYGGTAPSPTTQVASKTTTGNTTYTQTSLASNTSYYFRSYAANADLSSDYSSDATVTTKPAAPTITAGTVGQTTIVVNWATAADGNAENKLVQYSLDGTTWVTLATVTTGSASSGTYTIENLTPDTSYTIQTRVYTSVGTAAGATLSVKTQATHKFYGSVGGVSKKTVKWYGSVNGQTKAIVKIYGSVGGVTKRIF